jgi:hypothetical protein
MAMLLQPEILLANQISDVAVVELELLIKIELPPDFKPSIVINLASINLNTAGILVRVGVILTAFPDAGIMSKEFVLLAVKLFWKIIGKVGKANWKGLT